MSGIVGIITFLIMLGLSLVITKVATIALSLTGLSTEAARFQARSAFTGTGFTTREAEKVVDHPVRRKIIMLLMVARSAGLVTIIISLILSFVGPGDETDRVTRLLLLLLGVAVLWALAKSKYVDQYLGIMIKYALNRWTELDTRDYMNLLKLSGEYKVTELQVKQGDWLEGKTLKECRLTDEGISILGIYRYDGSYVGAPHKDTEIYSGDTLILYGRNKVLHQLDRRRAGLQGEQAHEQAVGEQKRHEAEQDRKERAHKRKRQAEKKVPE